eukprot:scpid32567/ scgid9617/ Pleckstrin homology domain-containing family G member 4B
MAASNGSFQAVDAARDALPARLLCSRFAQLPGSTDRQGHPVIFIDLSYDSDILAFSKSEVRSLIDYFIAIDRWRNNDPKPFCVLVSMSSLEMAQRLADALNELSSSCEGLISDVIWVVHGGRNDVDSNSLPGVSSCTSKVVTVWSDDLENSIAAHQQPLDIGGGFLFDRSKWLHYRMHLEMILHQCEDCLQKAEAQLIALQSLAIDVNIHDVDINRRKAALLVSILTLRLPAMLNNSTRLLSELLAKGGDEMVVNMASTPHYSAAISGTRDAIDRLTKAKTSLQTAAGLDGFGQEELMVVGCGGEDCPLAKVQTHGIPGYFSMMRIGESLGETRQLLNDFFMFMGQCKSYMDNCQCISSSASSSDTSPCSLVVGCFSAALQHQSDQLNISMAIHMKSQSLVNWAILTLNTLASQFFGSKDVQACLFDLDTFDDKSPLPNDYVTELYGLYAKLGLPCVLVLHCHAVLKMVDTARLHLQWRIQYLNQKLDGSADAADGGGGTQRQRNQEDQQALEDEFALVGLSDDESDNQEESDGDEPMDEGNGSNGQSAASDEALTSAEAKFDHGSSFTPPRKVRAKEAVVEDEEEQSETTAESMFSVWLRRIRHVSETVSAVTAALIPPIPLPGSQLPKQLSTCVDDYPPASESWLINLQDSTEETLFANMEFVDADAAAYQAMMKQRQELIGELISQEEKYIEDLERIVKEYVIPFSHDSSRPTSLIGKKSGVFGNIEKILEFNQMQFYPALKQIRRAPLKLGACFLQSERQFSTYSLYFKNMPAQEQFLKKNADYFRMVQSERLQDPQPIETYLLQPLARMGKYRQCLQDLLKTAGDSDRMRSSREELESAAKLVSFHLRHGNDLLILAQVRGYSGNMAEEGLLLRQDDFVVTDGWGNHKRRVFLFEDLIMFTKAQTSKKTDTVYQFKSSYKVAEFGLKETIADSPHKFELTFRKSKPIVLTADSQLKRDEWVAELHNILLRQFERLKERMKEVQIGNEPIMSRPSYETGSLSRARGSSFLSGTGSGATVGSASRYSSSSAQSGNTSTSTVGAAAKQQQQQQ